mmetsp:Transcript_29574/g.68670  ORF Transcript_29574/g.68670 Transcript_29574/m.68670 type:complete len:89 (-) Transcript_29574:601-867(-)
MCTAVVSGLVPSNSSAFDIYKPKGSPTYSSRFALKLRDDIGRAPLTTTVETNAEPLAASTTKRRNSFDDAPRNLIKISDASKEGATAR